MEIMKHNNILDKMEDDDNNWKCQELLEHRIKGRKNNQDIEAKCRWNDINQTTSWVDMFALAMHCLLYTSPSPRDGATSRMPSSA